MTHAAQNTTWQTKWGPRRVRIELPTLEEALDAAAGLTADPQQQTSIAAGLMQLPIEEVRAATAALLLRRVRRPQTFRPPHSRTAVVVERKATRRILVGAHR